MHNVTLQLLRTMAELKADSYEINWEEWEQNQDSEKLESLVEEGVATYEQHLLNMKMLHEPPDENGLDEEQVEKLEMLIDELIDGYIYQFMLQKKKAIEELISSI